MIFKTLFHLPRLLRKFLFTRWAANFHTFFWAGLILFFFAGKTMAADVTLAWDANTETHLAGYKLYYDGDSDSETYGGTDAVEGDSPIVIYLEDLADSDAPTFTLTGLTSGEYYYFSLTAFDTDGTESDFSDEVGLLIDDDSDASDSGGAVAGDDGTTDGSGGSSGGGCFISNTVTREMSLSQVAAGIALFLWAIARRVRPTPRAIPDSADGRKTGDK